MKKAIALTLALCMVLSLAACGGGKSTPANNRNAAPANNSANTVPANSGSNTPSNSGSNTPADASVPDIGKWDGPSHVYTNDFFNLKLTVPADWSKRSSSANKIGNDPILVLAGKDNSNINIIIDKWIQVGNDSDAELFASFEPYMKKSMADSGFEVTKYETVNSKFMGQDKDLLHMELKSGDTIVNMYELFLHGKNDYAATITITLLGNNDIQTAINYFSTIK